MFKIKRVPVPPPKDDEHSPEAPYPATAYQPLHTFPQHSRAYSYSSDQSPPIGFGQSSPQSPQMSFTSQNPFDDPNLCSYGSAPGLNRVPTSPGIHDFKPMLKKTTSFGGSIGSSLLQHDSYGRKPSVAGSVTAHAWSRGSQRVWLLFSFIWRWIFTIVLCSASIIAMWRYEAKWILDTKDKHIFNFLITALAIGIGTNLTSSLSHMAEKARWLLLSLTSLPPNLFEMVMEIEKPTKVMKLMWHAKGRWLLRLAGLLWLLVNLAAQVGPAMLGLTYTLGKPIDVGKTHIAASLGNASVTDVRQIATMKMTNWQSDPNHNSEDFLNIQRSAANDYGQMSAGWGESKLNSSFFAGTAFYTDYFKEVTEKKWLWSIRFFDYLVSDKNYLNPEETVVSHRYVLAYANCSNVSPNKVWVEYGTPSKISWVIGDRNHTAISPNEVFNSTTYISSTEPAGPRSAQVMVFWSGLVEGESYHFLYECTSYVSYVKYLSPWNRPMQEELQLPNEQARIVAGAIGWNGLTTSREKYQTRTYSTGSRWSFDASLRPWAVADIYVGRFSIGVLNAMNFEGPRRIVSHVLIPDGGLILVAKWNYIGAVVGLIIFSHLVLLVFTDLILARVLVRDGGPYATAVFLRPLVRNIPNGTGNMLRGEEIAKTVGVKNIIYTWEESRETMKPVAPGYDSLEKDTDGVRYLRARAGNIPIERKRFDTGIYD